MADVLAASEVADDRLKCNKLRLKQALHFGQTVAADTGFQKLTQASGFCSDDLSFVSKNWATNS